MNMHDDPVPVLKVFGAAEKAVPESEKMLVNGFPTITKSDLIIRLIARFPQLPAKDTDYAVKMILDTMIATLYQGWRIEIRGFGSFSLIYRSARIGRNPKSGEQVSIPGKWAPHFKTGKELRERVR